MNARVQNNRGKYCSKRCADEAKVRIADPVSHFWRHVIQTSGCWQWNDVVSPFGYGVIHYRKTIILIHRLSWEIHNGNIPAGLCVLHQCDNPPCSNPSHLFLGTKATNNRDRADKGRGAIGSLAGSAKLTEDAVRDIRRRHAPAKGRRSAKRLAAEFGVDEGTIYAAVRGETWKHVE